MTLFAIDRAPRRGACPGLSAPMPTGDGLLVRLLPVGTVALDAFAALCAAARRHGNGVIEITARGSIQVRGLNATSAPRFAQAVAALDVAAADGVPVLSNALAGLDPEEILDAAALAADLRRALEGTPLAASLAPKVSVAIDGGGVLNLDDLAADIRLRAQVVEGDVALRVGVGGDGAGAINLGIVAPAHGIEAVMRSLAVIAGRGDSARARDVLAAEGPAAFRLAVGDLFIASAPSPNRGKFQEPIGLHRLRHGSLACGIGLAFGHADASSLQRLIEAAAANGANGVRAAPGRALLIIGLTDDTAPTFAADAERLGFVVRADDPRRYVMACAGAPLCASAHIAARSVAPVAAEAAGRYLEPGFEVHISGCAKGCAHPRPSALTVVGSPDGCALIANGSARDASFATVAPDDLPAAIARFAQDAKREAEREKSHV